ncbi:MAG: NAD-dependent 4,6-dehydratase LegB [Sediminibacterium sp.]|nr:NAD-dependent 4,6-dehydratase LegB [Sediminibacterium sp.]
MNKVLVTGADGFIGSHLVESLLETGVKVKALCYYNSFNFWGWLDGVQHPNLEIVSGDVRDYNFCLKVTEDVSVIYHLAALIAIPYSYIAPDSYIDTNVKGTSNICLAAIKNNVSKVIHTSTSEVYGSAKYVPIDELHPLQPQSPYSASKIAADSMALSYYNSFNLPLVIARPFNTYGPRQSARAIIPTIISQMAAGKKHIQIGDLTPTRDLNYVKDTCAGFIELANTPDIHGQTVNIGSNFEVSMLDLFNLIKELMHSQAEATIDESRIRPEKSEVQRLWCDNSKIKELTKFQPQFTLKSGLKETIKWFTDPENLKKYKTDIYNV